MKPELTADGSKIAFWRQENQGRPSAAFVAELRRAPDGTLLAGTPRQLPAAAPEGAGWPWSWSPDGTMLWYDPDRWRESHRIICTIRPARAERSNSAILNTTWRFSPCRPTVDGSCFPSRWPTA